MKKDTIPIKNLVGFGNQNLTSSKSGLENLPAGRQEIKLEGIPLQTYHP